MNTFKSPALWVLAIVLRLGDSNLLAQDSLIIQENEIGFCAVDGLIMTSVTGYTGSGYADTDRGIGKSISWQFHVAAGGTYAFVWRYGNGGTVAPRNATLLIDGKVVRDTIFFPHTGTWTNWTFSAPVEITLAEGDHKIRIEAHSTDGLGNYDYFKVLGSGMTAIQCLPSFVLSVKSSNEDWGTVSYEPDLKYYDQGTPVTLRARAKPGYFFESWTGEETSADSVFTFQVKGNVNAVARFLPNGTTRDSSIAGYATVQDDRGTPYLVTGGALGQKVDARSIADLHTYLESPNPYVVQLSDELTGTDVINVTSDKTLLGVGDKAHLRGIELSINEARNVIIRNIAISHVTPQDAVEINGKSKNIVIDHCEFFSDRDHGEDFYDGLLDIKNESSFITVSWTRFHDHYKTCLISSGDQQVADSVIRITFHHNYFHNCGSRLPSIRFGKTHIFNNYYRDCGTAVNSRMGAWVRVERNYFERVGTAVMTEFSSTIGRVQLIDNEFGTSAVTTTPTCDLQVPYAYQHLLDSTMALPTIIPVGTRTVTNIEVNEPTTSFRLMVFPNPFNPLTTIRYALPVRSTVTIVVRDVLGKQIAVLVNEEKPPGLYEVSFSGENAASGVYFVTMRADSFTETRRMILLK